jgi:hypothetical protein
MTSSSGPTLERIARGVPIPEPAYERLLRRRDRKRRNQRIAAGVVGIAVFVGAVGLVTTLGSSDRTQPGVSGGVGTGPTATGPPVTQTVAPETDHWDGGGLPPEGAIPSTPETGELIAERITPLGSGDVFVYADGRVIWNSYRLNERRLTPEGLDLVRSGAIQPEDLNPGPPSVPADAWADAEARPYVPPRYAVCYFMVSGPGFVYEYPYTVLPFFPAPARAILRGELSHGIVGGAAGDPDSPECSAVTAEEARALDEMLSGVRVEDSEGGEIGTELLPILPHGPGFSSGG